MRFVLFFLISLKVFSQNIDFESEFKNFFNQHFSYQDSFENIKKFLFFLKKKDFKFENVQIVKVRNIGISLFGLVKIEKSRILNNSERNVHSHAFMIYKNKVYDFEFTEKPLILSLSNYIDEMFLNESKSNNIIGKNEKLFNYKAIVYQPENFLNPKQDSEKETKIYTLNKLLNKKQMI